MRRAMRKSLAEALLDKVRSSRETVALATEVAQSGGQVLRASSAISMARLACDVNLAEEAQMEALVQAPSPARSPSWRALGDEGSRWCSAADRHHVLARV